MAARTPGTDETNDALHARPLPSAKGRPPSAADTQDELSDREWVRLLLALAASSGIDGEVALAWRLEPGGASAFMESNRAAPSPFLPLSSSSGWWVEKDAQLRTSVTQGAINAASRHACLLTLWNEGTRCLLDVVGARTLAIDGPPVAVGYTLADIVIELAQRRWSDVSELWLVGFGREIPGLENVRYLDRLGDALTLLDRVGTASGEGARCFVIAPMRVEESQRATLRRVLRLVEQTPSTAAICCDTSVQARCTWFVAAHGKTVHLEVRGRNGPAAILTPNDWALLTKTMGTLGDEFRRRSVGGHEGPNGAGAEVGPESPLAKPQAGIGTACRAASPQVAPASTSGTISAPVDAGPTAPTAEAGALARDRPGVGVLVLGPVEVRGSAESLEGRALLTELVTYLAFHPEGASGEACATVLWPDRRVPSQTLSNRLHEARRALGTTAEGAPRLWRSAGRHLLSADVRTDWGRFVGLTGDASGPASWRQALMLVRGRPFDGLTRGDWTVLEGHASTIEARVVAVAERLGDHLLRLGDPLGAEWAVRRALAVAPWDERLYRLLMWAAEAAGNRGGVDSALRALAQVLDADGDPLLVVHPETAALYRKLTGAAGPR